MATVRDPGGSAELDAVRRRIERGGALATLLVVVPMVVGVVVAATSEWLPASDHALIEATVRDLWAGELPLTGPFSRYGYDHPGPLLFYVLALPYEAFGDDPRGMLVGAAVVNLAAAVYVVRVAVARGPRFGLATAGIVNVLVWSLSTDAGALLLPWNPYVAVLPFLALVFACWRVSDGSVPALVVVALAGSWVLQNHVGYGLLVAGLGVVALALGARRVGRTRRTAVWVLAAVAIGTVLWVPVAIDQVAGSGNAGAILSWVGDSSGTALGWDAAVAVAGPQLVPRAAWSGATGVTDTLAGGLAAGEAWLLLAPLAALVLANDTALRLRDTSMAKLCVVAATAVGLGVVSLSRVVGVVAPYVVLWLRPIAAVVWLLALWAAWRTAAPAVVRSRRAGVVATAVVAVAAFASSVLATAGVVVQPRPGDGVSPVVDAVADAVAARADRDEPVIVGTPGTANLVIGAGVLVELERRGFTVFQPRPDDGAALAASEALVGAHRIAPEGLAAPTIMIYVGRTDVGRIDADPAQRVVARWSNLSDDLVDTWRDVAPGLTDLERRTILEGGPPLDPDRPAVDQPVAAWRHVEQHWDPVVAVEVTAAGP